MAETVFLSLAVLATAQAVSAKLSWPGLDPFEESVADVNDQLAMLIYPGFLAGVGEGRVGDVHRLEYVIRVGVGPAPERASRIKHVDADLFRLDP